MDFDLDIDLLTKWAGGREVMKGFMARWVEGWKKGWLVCYGGCGGVGCMALEDDVCALDGRSS